jgi:fucose 4-O-acetylase-like acetyltransferase
MTKTKRIEYIDLLKGFGILLMVYGHILSKCHQHYYMDLYLHAFHMPLFFFISGFLYRNYNSLDFVKRKAQTLLIPYLFFCGINFVFSYFLRDDFQVGRYFERIFFYNNKSIGICASLWFLTALFFIEIIYLGLDNLLKKSSRKGLYLTIITVVIGLFVSHFSLKLPYSITSSLCMLPIFHFGVLFKEHREKFKIPTLVPCVCLTLSLFTIVKNGTINIRSNIYNNYLLSIINATIVILGYWFIFERIKINQYLSWVKYIGVNSLYYLALNQIAIHILVVTLGIHSNFIVFVISLVILYVCAEILNKKSNWFGKTNTASANPA